MVDFYRKNMDTVRNFLLMGFLLLIGCKTALSQPVTYQVACVLITERDTDNGCHSAKILPELRDNLSHTGVELVVEPAQSTTSQIYVALEDSNLISSALTVIVRGVASNNTLPVSPLVVKHFPVIYKGNPTPDEALNILSGLILYDAGQCDDADIFFMKAQTGDEKDFFTSVLPRFYRANCAILSKDYKTALSILDVQNLECVTYFDQDAFYCQNLAWLYVQNNQKEKAFVLLNKLIDDSSQGKSHFLGLRARFYALTFDYKSALADTDAAIELTPDSTEFYSIRGQVHLLLYEWENARKDFNKAIELDDTYAEAYFYRGVLHYTLIERKDAQADFEQYLVLAPDGRYADEAARYVDSIKIEIEASGD